MDLAQLLRWQVEDRLTITKVAARAGRPASTIAETLRKAGLTTPPRRPERPALDPDMNAPTLTHLYVTHRLDDHAIGAQLGVPAWRVTVRRRELGVNRPHVPPPHPSPPPPPPPEVLRRLHLAAAPHLC